MHEVLEALGAAGKPLVTAFNKIDRVPSPEVLAALRARTPNSVLISATQKQGLEDLVKLIEALIPEPFVRCELAVPYTDGHIVGWLHEHGRILSERHTAEATHISVELPAALMPHVQAYRLT